MSTNLTKALVACQTILFNSVTHSLPYGYHVHFYLSPAFVCSATLIRCGAGKPLIMHPPLSDQRTALPGWPAFPHINGIHSSSLFHTRATFLPRFQTPNCCLHSLSLKHLRLLTRPKQNIWYSQVKLTYHNFPISVDGAFIPLAPKTGNTGIIPDSSLSLPHPQHLKIYLTLLKTWMESPTSFPPLWPPPWSNTHLDYSKCLLGSSLPHITHTVCSLLCRQWNSLRPA